MDLKQRQDFKAARQLLSDFIGFCVRKDSPMSLKLLLVLNGILPNGKLVRDRDGQWVFYTNIYYD